MNKKTVWIHVGLVAILAGAFAGGILYQRHGWIPHADHAGHGDEAARFLEHFQESLDLTGAQASQVKSILDGLHAEMVVLRNGFHEQFQTKRNRAWEGIRATLTEPQRSTFAKLVEEMENDHAGR